MKLFNRKLEETLCLILLLIYLLKLQISFLLFGQTMLLISLRKEKSNFQYVST